MSEERGSGNVNLGARAGADEASMAGVDNCEGMAPLPLVGTPLFTPASALGPARTNLA